MISHSAEYSLRAVVCLASMPAGKALTTRQIASAARVPVGYLAKVLNALSRAGIITSQRGAGGGHVLARDPARLNLLDIVHVVDPSRRIEVCPLGTGSHNRALCPLHRRLDQTVAIIEQLLRSATVADILAESSAAQSLCDCRSRVLAREVIPCAK